MIPSRRSSGIISSDQTVFRSAWSLVTIPILLAFSSFADIREFTFLSLCFLTRYFPILQLISKLRSTRGGSNWDLSFDTRNRHQNWFQSYDEPKSNFVLHKILKTNSSRLGTIVLWGRRQNYKLQKGSSSGTGSGNINSCLIHSMK